ncbi:MAG TPA: SDR family NAD(P)-dependent oxidoreductase [Actinomycetota bacterium]
MNQTPTRVFLVTGASSGIGEAAARRLVREPAAHVILLARRRERLEALAAELTAAGGSASVIGIDLTDYDAPGMVAAVLERDHGRLDLLVNNAGVGGRGSFAESGFAEVQRTMRVNFGAPVRLTEALLPLLRRSAPSAIVNVASVAGRVGRPGTSAYSASKFALIGWSESLQLEERPHGVHVGLVVPGFVSTEGFPQRELLAHRATRWLVSTTDKVADAITEVGLGRKAERYAPRPWAVVPFLKVLLPGLYRRAVGGGRFTAAAKR